MRPMPSMVVFPGKTSMSSMTSMVATPEGPPWSPWWIHGHADTLRRAPVFRAWSRG